MIKPEIKGEYIYFLSLDKEHPTYNSTMKIILELGKNKRRIVLCREKLKNNFKGAQGENVALTEDECSLYRWTSNKQQRQKILEKAYNEIGLLFEDVVSMSREERNCLSSETRLKLIQAEKKANRESYTKIPLEEWIKKTKYPLKLTKSFMEYSSKQILPVIEDKSESKTELQSLQQASYNKRRKAKTEDVELQSLQETSLESKELDDKKNNDVDINNNNNDVGFQE